MNRFVSSLVMVLLALPMVLPWMPHEVTHALHDQSISHREANLYSGATHNHADEHLQKRFVKDVQSTTHHNIDVSVVTYFDEYFLIDLASSKQMVSATPAESMQDIDAYWSPYVLPQQSYKQTSHRNQTPLTGRAFRPSQTSVYLYTQRFRV